jgi:serine/threonine protein kinase/TPR repeat protein
MLSFIIGPDFATLRSRGQEKFTIPPKKVTGATHLTNRLAAGWSHFRRTSLTCAHLTSALKLPMPQPLRFAHFEVLMRSDGSPHLLGQGAMGATYKALDQNLLSLAVIKVPSVELLAYPAARQRFLQEAQMMARLRHPHVANVFYYGESSSGPFYAMEFCDGPSVHDYVDQHGPFDVQDTFRLAVQAAAALQALDSHELIHRDLKPSNILLTSDSSGGAHVKLIDFGVAREGIPADTGGLTLGGFIGTPAFASPEQLLEASHLDSRSDLYSLGAVMWFCLTGNPPFLGSQFEIMFHHVNTEPDWRLLPEMPEASLHILKRLLAKSAEERHPSPAALVQDLQNLLGIAAATGNTLQLRTSHPDSEKSSLGGYEILEAIGSDDFGKVWLARDILTGNIVNLRELPAEFAQKQGLILRLQRLAAVLRPLDHPRWQRLLHFEHSGAECRLASERISGPTALQLLKAHQQLSLSLILPLLTQIAEAMDFAASQGLTAMETAIERLYIAVEGWENLTEAERSSLLRRPLQEWNHWSVKVCPLRLSHSTQDYVLPSDSQAAQAITRLSTDFIQLCYRLLTGQGRSGNAYIPSPSLTAESNDFFERHFTGQRPQTPQTCHTLLRLLCLAEGVPAPQPPEDELEDPYATRLVTRRAVTSLHHKTSPAPSSAPSVRDAFTSSSDDITLTAARDTTGSRNRGLTSLGALLDSDTFMAAAGAPVSERMRDLEKRRAELEAEAERLREDERVQAERDWIARERAALEQARQEVAAHEHERAQRLAEEQARLAEQKQQLEQQQALIEEKRREQQRLEQEIQLRAQLDFQKLQEEAKARESDLQRQRAAVEEALQARELDFQQREKQSLERIEALKHEAAQLEEEVQQEYLTVRHLEAQQSRRLQEEVFAEELAREKLAVEERKLDEMRQQLEARANEFESTRKSRFLLLFAGSIAAVMLAATVAYFIKGRIELQAVDYRELTGSQQWQSLQQERLAAKDQQKWANLLAWCTAAEESLRSSPESQDTVDRYLNEIYGDANLAITGLIESPNQLPPTATPDHNKLIDQLHQTQTWPLDKQRHLLAAKLLIPTNAATGHPLQAIDLYLAALKASPDFAHDLQSELTTILAVIRQQMVAKQITAHQPILQHLDLLRSSSPTESTPPINQLYHQIQADEAFRSSNYTKALTILLDAVQTNPNWTNDLKLQATDIISQLSQLQPAAIFPIFKQIELAAETWKLPEAWIILAQHSDPETGFRYYQLAEQGGSQKAGAFVGRAMLDTGLARNDQHLVDQGIAKLQAGVDAEDPDAMILLGEAYFAGRGVSADAQKSLDLAARAQAKKHPGADYLAGKALIFLGETTGEAGHFDKATELLQRAVESNQPNANFFLYQSYYNAVKKNPQRALDALEKGAIAKDPLCLYTLGIWHYAGQPPAKLDQIRARQLIEQAASLGHPSAVKWLQQYPK